MKKLLDLRFVIGVFFTVTGILLTGYYFISGSAPEAAVNLYCGIAFIIFGIIMIIASNKPVE